jgi:predicted Zn-dependent protease
MKNRIQTLRLILAGWLLAMPTLHAQTYSVDWHKVAGGGGTSTNSQYTISGTIGQPDASGAMSSGQYSVTGGFWSLISVVQTAGLPNLTITHSGSTVTVSWPNTGSYTLQQNANLAVSGGWATSGYTITTASGTNSITLTSPTGNLFFRLSNP